MFFELIFNILQIKDVQSAKNSNKLQNILASLSQIFVEGVNTISVLTVYIRI